MEKIDLDNLDSIPFLVTRDVYTKSYFDGETFSVLALNIFTYLSSLISLGLAFPFTFTFEKEYEVSHTFINGRNLYFDGRSHQLIGKYILHLLLSIVTLGIYSFKLNINVTRWTYKHTYDVSKEVKEEYFTLLDSLNRKDLSDKEIKKLTSKKDILEKNYDIRGESKFLPNLISNFTNNMISKLITIVTLGILYPYALCYRQKFVINNTLITGKRLKFIGEWKSLFKKYIYWYLYVIATFGIYAFVVNIKIKRWVSSNVTYLNDKIIEFNAN